MGETNKVYRDAHIYALFLTPGFTLPHIRKFLGSLGI